MHVNDIEQGLCGERRKEEIQVCLMMMMLVYECPWIIGILLYSGWRSEKHRRMKERKAIQPEPLILPVLSLFCHIPTCFDCKSRKQNDGRESSTLVSFFFYYFGFIVWGWKKGWLDGQYLFRWSIKQGINKMTIYQRERERERKWRYGIYILTKR